MGILPIDYYDKKSNLSYIFLRILQWMAKCVGFTDEEDKILCEKYINFKNINNSNKSQIVNNKNNNKRIEVDYENIKEWHNDYQLITKKNGKKYEIYTPFSVIKSLNYNHIEKYWNKYETFPLLSEYINMTFFWIKRGYSLFNG